MKEKEVRLKLSFGRHVNAKINTIIKSIDILKFINLVILELELALSNPPTNLGIFLKESVRALKINGM